MTHQEFHTFFTVSEFAVHVVTTLIFPSNQRPVFRLTWLSCFCRSSGPPPRPTNWSTVSTTNGWEGKYWLHSIHSHVSHSQPRSNIFSQPPLISFKRDKNIGNFLVRSLSQTSDQPRTFKCARLRCKTCPFNVEKMSGPKRSIKVTAHSTRTSASVIYCITCTYCKRLYTGETGRPRGDRFRVGLCEVERNDKDTSKSVARHFCLPKHSKQHMTVCGLSLHLGSLESRKTLEQKFILQSVLLISMVSTSVFHSTNSFLFSRHHIPTIFYQ